MTNTTIVTGLDLTKLGRWNWIQIRGLNFSTYIITAYQSIKSRIVIGTTFLKRERY